MSKKSKSNPNRSSELEVVEVEIGEVQPKHHRHRSSSSPSHHHHRRHRHHRSSHHRKKILRRVLISVGASLLALVLLVVGAFFFLSYRGRQEMVMGDYNIAAPSELAVARSDGQYVEYNGEMYRLREELVNILFLGVDKYNETDAQKEIGKNGQADVLMVAAVDPDKHAITFVNLPRDVMTDIKVYSRDGGYTGMENMQICMSYAYGDGKETSCLNTLDAVKRVFYNLPVNSYYALDLAGIADINDAIGGVDVTSPDTFDTFVKDQEYHLDGKLATSFVVMRSHEEAEANLKRNERQRVYMTAFFQKVVSSLKGNVGSVLNLYNVAEPYSCTDFNVQRVTYLAGLMATGSYSMSVRSIPVTVTQEGNYAKNFIKEKEFYELFLSVFYEKVE